MWCLMAGVHMDWTGACNFLAKSCHYLAVILTVGLQTSARSCLLKVWLLLSNEIKKMYCI